ncbi:MAG TPA: hypothetical protein VMK12_03885 [Anaeromyxobacteraceae bacterium]|nr:hypothetical protein [Anaeromyxobacteraceae bacterium]
MAWFISSMVPAMAEEDGDLGDPRGSIALVMVSTEESTPVDHSLSRACVHCGVRLIVRSPNPTTQNDSEEGRVDLRSLL